MLCLLALLHLPVGSVIIHYMMTLDEGNWITHHILHTVRGEKTEAEVSWFLSSHNVSGSEARQRARMLLNSGSSLWASVTTHVSLHVSVCLNSTTEDEFGVWFLTCFEWDVFAGLSLKCYWTNEQTRELCVTEKCHTGKSIRVRQKARPKPYVGREKLGENNICLRLNSVIP